MKIRIFVITIAFFVVLVKGASSQNPTYILNATNITRTLPNEYTFEIRMQHTNSPVYFEYAGGQYFFDFNKEIANGGILTLSFAPDSSDLPLNMRPRNPTAYTVSTPGQLRLAVNTFPGPGNGYFGITTNAEGTKIIKLKLKTTALTFASTSLDLRWRNTIVSPRTKVFAYVQVAGTEITDTNKHFVDSAAFLIPFDLDVKFGIEALMNEGSHRIIDTVDIQIRSANSPFTLVHNQKSIVNQNSLTAKINNLFPNGIYYIVIKHKNSLETWSKPGGELLGNGNYFYDFTTSASQAYGNNMVLKDGLYCIYSGNVNGDDVIDAEDLLEVDNAVFNYALGSSIENLNGDNIVDIEDMAICDNNARAIRVVERPEQIH